MYIGVKISAVVFLMSLIAPPPAYAYLDPGTGSMILQVIIAAIVGAGCTLGIYKKKLIIFFKGIFDDGKEK